MAVPFRRTSKTRKRMRRTHFKLEVTGLVTCSHCGAMIKSHTVCPSCGYYNGKPVLVKPKQETEVKKAEPKKKAKPTKVVKTPKEEPKQVKATKTVKAKAKPKVETGKQGDK